MTLHQATLTAFWGLNNHSKQDISEKNLKINSVRKDERFSYNTTFKYMKTAPRIKDITSSTSQIIHPSRNKKIQKNLVKTVKNHVCEAFKKRLGNLICKLNQEKDLKSVQSTTSNTTQEQNNQSQNRKKSQFKFTQPNYSKSSKIQETESLVQQEQTSTSIKVEKQEILKLKKKMKQRLPFRDHSKFEQKIVNQQIQNAQIRFWNGFHYSICLDNKSGSDFVWVNTKEIMKLNPNWLLQYFNSFI